MKFFLSSLLLFFALLLESTIIQLPLVLLVLCTFAVIYRTEWIFPLGFIAGIWLDELLFRPVGSSSLFFLLFLFIIFLYERKFELRSIWFVVFISCIGSLLFLLLFGHTQLLLQVLVSVGMGLLLFFLFSFFQPLPQRDMLGTWKREDY